MRFNIIISAVILSLITVVTNGQNNYYATDSLIRYGIKLVDGSDIINSAFCRVKKGEEVIEYSSDEIKEYGFKDGRVFIAKDISVSDTVRRVFMERLVNGETNLYYYRGKKFKVFYLEKDSTVFQPVYKGDISYKDNNGKLTGFTSDCPNVYYASQLVRYHRGSLSEFISRYNKCTSKPFPFLKYGFFIGMIQSKPVIGTKISNEILKNATFRSDYSFYGGVFIDAPLLVSDFSIFTSIGFYQAAFVSIISTEHTNNDILINQSIVKIPVLLRYFIPALKYRSYINAGVNYSTNIKNDNTVYRAIIGDGIVEFASPETGKIIADNQLGYAFGIGIQYYLNYKRIAFAEIRFNKEFSNPSSNKFNRNSLELISGINF